MSWSYTLHQINRSFEQIVQWYREFMHRTETSFQAFHERVKYLEQRQAQQDDEQLERVLRKILAEKFVDPSAVSRSELANGMRNGTFVMSTPNDPLAPKPVDIDAASLAVDPEAVPSKSYGETLKMLESKLHSFPEIDKARSKHQDDDPDFKRPRAPNHTN
ncbi:hypothetical protein P280DRAFT_489103 [Massarina eburnea CBS 473.64]|uniref:Uncharacterized protein n=1 Tax=Massarina eburnea CBS 473.64 TaxID=1395130 RepID=A0A6A6S5G2_9PLEO|nr:hypothetical protein P280DRAFT_489103 [Massarina eburnea CBS 473.64]